LSKEKRWKEGRRSLKGERDGGMKMRLDLFALPKEKANITFIYDGLHV
jgi:hypothetical protein